MDLVYTGTKNNIQDMTLTFERLPKKPLLFAFEIKLIEIELSRVAASSSISSIYHFLLYSI